MPTTSVENYLKALYHLQGTDNRRVSTSDLAEHLQLTLPSTTGMLRSLSESGWIEYQPYRGATLTATGRAQALRVIRNHRLIEAFLVQVLDYTWDEVHAEAERLEHAISDELANRIDAFLGHPAADPHGDPIPRGLDFVEPAQGQNLGDYAGPPARFVLNRVTNQDSDLLRYLNEIGLIPGARFRVVERLPFDGPLMIIVDDRASLPIGKTIARNLQVTLLAQ